MDVRRYLTVVRRHIVLIVVLMLALGGAAYAYSASKTPIYESTAQLLYVPQLNIQDPLSQSYTDPTTQELQMQSAVTLITGPTIEPARAHSDRRSSAVPDYSVSRRHHHLRRQLHEPGRQRRRGDRRLDRPQVGGQARQRLCVGFRGLLPSSRDQASICKCPEGHLRQLNSTTARRAPETTRCSQESLNSLEILYSTTTGDFSMAVPAGVSSVPISPKPKRSAAIGLVLGLILGIGFGFLREKLDTRLHDHREVGEILNMPVIGRVPKIPEQRWPRVRSSSSTTPTRAPPKRSAWCAPTCSSPRWARPTRCSW